MGMWKGTIVHLSILFAKNQTEIKFNCAYKENAFGRIEIGQLGCITKKIIVVFIVTVTLELNCFFLFDGVGWDFEKECLRRKLKIYNNNNSNNNNNNKKNYRLSLSFFNGNWDKKMKKKACKEKSKYMKFIE